MGFIFKFLLFTFVFIYIGGKVMGFLLKYFIRSKMKDFESGPQRGAAGTNRQEGSIRVEHPSGGKNKPNTTGGGEYVDFEEIK